MIEPLPSNEPPANINPDDLAEVEHQGRRIVETKNIQLLEERLVVKNIRHKVGEVIVRKVVETQMVQVPIRREKLIVEKVYPEYKQIAEIGLDAEDIIEIEQLETAKSDGKDIINVTFSSPTEAIKFLEAIALESRCEKVKMDITIAHKNS
ncbi:MAG: DUF2382 domain-containing protein [Nostocaceae cyanobacterium]|nr:DUF2382 domain-containing protein [Nostocaceae cyanobacterium]